MENQPLFPRYLFVMRHAEKVSNVTGEKTANTLITQNGINQAVAAGNFIAKEILNLDLQKKDKKVLIMCSPYLRCLQTTKHIVERLREKGGHIIHENSVYVTNFIKENQKGKNGKRKLPISGPEIESDLKEFQKDQTEFEVKMSEIQMGNPEEEYELVETKDDLKERFGTFLEKMNTSSTVDGYDGQVVVCISHAMFLKQAKKIHEELHSDCSPLKIPYKYTTVSCIKFSGINDWNFLIDGHSTHIEKRGQCRYDTYGTQEFVSKDGDPESPNVQAIKKNKSKQDDSIKEIVNEGLKLQKFSSE